LLASNVLREVLAEAVENYDQIIVDGPPVLLVSDAAVLAALVDGVIVVCRTRTSRGMVQRARAQLAVVNARLIGAVLNAAETTRGGYFRKYYRAFYDYQEQDVDEEAAAEDIDALPPASGDRDGTPQAADDAVADASSGRDALDELIPPEDNGEQQGLDPSVFLEEDAGPDVPPKEGGLPGEGGDETKPSDA
jgi:Mrp family chromosome partitioning ATPase